MSKFQHRRHKPTHVRYVTSTDDDVSKLEQSNTCHRFDNSGKILERDKKMKPHEKRAVFQQVFFDQFAFKFSYSVTICLALEMSVLHTKTVTDYY